MEKNSKKQRQRRLSVSKNAPWASPPPALWRFTSSPFALSRSRSEESQFSLFSSGRADSGVNVKANGERRNP